MQTWFEVSVKYVKIDQDGREKKVTEAYLFDAVSFSDAEALAIKEFQQRIRGEFSIENIRKTNILEIIDQDGEYWYKGAISVVTIDEHMGKEKKVKNYFMVSADDFTEAKDRLSEGLAYILVPYTIESMSITKILEVFPYFKDEEITEKITSIEPDTEDCTEDWIEGQEEDCEDLL